MQPTDILAIIAVAKKETAKAVKDSLPIVADMVRQEVAAKEVKTVFDAAVTIKGDKGDKGDKGEKGDRGDAGKDGIDGLKGDKGERGLKGDKGDTGANGKDGKDAKGKDGKDGVGVADVAIGVDGHLYVGLTNGAVIDAGVARGSDGKDGKDGAIVYGGGGGSVASSGGSGAGVDGQDGASAYDIAVANGFTGSDVEWLASLVGAQGPQGSSGATGPVGPQGAQGPTGDAGPQGIQGPKGDTGDQGPQGPAGADAVGLSPGGADGQLQFNNGGVFAGASNVAVDATGNLVLMANTSKPAPPASGGLQIYGRERAGAIWPEVQRSSGRDFPLQAHFGVNRVAAWTPSVSTTVVTFGMPRTAVGTVTHPSLASTAPALRNSARRWRVASAATANASADERSSTTLCWRGNADGLGGWTYTNRISITAVQAASVALFGLMASTAALSTTQTIAAIPNVVGIGFTNGTHTEWQLIRNDGSGVPTQTSLGEGFPINTTDLLTLFIWAGQNTASIFVRVVNETTGATFDAELTTDIPASTTFLSIRNFMHNGGAAAAVSYDCCGVYLETDF